MPGKVRDVAQALATLQQARTALMAKLDREPAWQALCQLDARETDGDPLGTVDGAELRARLVARLDASVKGWRTLSGLDAAIAALEAAPLADLPLATRRSTSATSMDPPPLPASPWPGHAAQAGPAIGQPAQARNRSLAEAVAAIQGLDASRDEAVDASTLGRGRSPARPSAVSEPSVARDILGRIRSVDSTPPAPGTGSPAAKPDPRAARSLQSRLSAAASGAADRNRNEPPPRAAAPRPAALAQDSAARVAALERELDRLVRDDIRANAAPQPADAQPIPPTGPVVESETVEEAEIEIVATAAESDDGHRWQASDSAPDLAGDARLSSDDAESFVPFYGVIDEASVEIVRLDEQPADSSKKAPGPAHSPGMRRHPAPRRPRDA